MLDMTIIIDIISITVIRHTEKEEPLNNHNKIKSQLLKEQGVLNPKPQDVKDDLFKKCDFFDPHDLVQVKYEMVRSVEKDKCKITKTANNFGFSRPSFYAIQNAFNKKGIPGLIPNQRGPKGAHKLTDEVTLFIEESIAKDETLRASTIASLIEERFGIKIHPRTIERTLEKKKKKRKKQEQRIKE